MSDMLDLLSGTCQKSWLGNCNTGKSLADMLRQVHVSADTGSNSAWAQIDQITCGCCLAHAGKRFWHLAQQRAAPAL